MASKKSKLDLLVRVRYSNPLPPPPFPPKLLNIPTHPSRYARLEFTNALAAETPLPMVVDAECGMPLDLSVWDSLWDPTLDGSDLNPSSTDLPELDPRDAMLLLDLPDQPHANGRTTPSNAPSASPNVAWLRSKAEYFHRDAVQRGASSQELKIAEDAVVDVSRPAQISDIEATFPAFLTPVDLSTLVHPTKRGVTAVETYDILPDSEIWANAYDVFKFSERPGEKPLDVPDPRLDCAVLRPMESDGDHFLAYYLNKEDEEAETFMSLRRAGDSDIPVTSFQFIRDYETVKIDQELNTDFVFVLDNGDSVPLNIEDSFSETRPPRPKGAYYKNIERRIILRKKKQNKNENVAYSDKWDVINVTHVPFSDEELEERAEMRAEVDDPEYLQRMVTEAAQQDEGLPPEAEADQKDGEEEPIEVDS